MSSLVTSLQPCSSIQESTALLAAGWRLESSPVTRAGSRRWRWRAPTRAYTSPLRDDQSRRTQELILDAFTELLADKRAGDITTSEIAERAGVSQPTVYRHFSDREALLAGLSARLSVLMDADMPEIPAPANRVTGRVLASFHPADQRDVLRRLPDGCKLWRHRYCSHHGAVSSPGL